MVPTERTPNERAGSYPMPFSTPPSVPIDVIGLGECMIQMTCEGSFYESTQYRRAIGGDVFNTLVAASRLGCQSAFVTQIAQDEFGQFLLDQFKSYRIHTQYIKAIKRAYNGLYFASQPVATGGPHQFLYYRRQSAASQLDPALITPAMFEGVRVVYATGITQSLSDMTRMAVLKAFQLAKKQGCLVCYDPNYRDALWTRPDEAMDAFIEVIPYVDVVLPSVEDLKPLFDFPSLEKTLEYFRLRGVALVALKQGAEGVTLGFKTWDNHVPVFPTEKVIDTVGAGDAFNGGFIYGLLNAFSLEDCATLGTIVASRSLACRGPLEGLPTQAEIHHLMDHMVPDQAEDDQPVAPSAFTMPAGVPGRLSSQS